MAFWAWTASIVVHMIVLTVFGFVQFTHSKTQQRGVPVPTAKVSRIKELIETAPITPKPKVKRLTGTEITVGTNTAGPKPASEQIFEAAKPENQDLEDLAKPSASKSFYALPNSGILPNRIEFFGSITDRRKVCFVVDCSGSMRGVFGRVKKELKESVEELQADQYFYIIFFGGEKLYETGGGRLLRAREKAKSAACDFIDSVGPAGRTNALTALERAVQIRDGRGVSPSVIYFLTDGFELTTEDAQGFSRKVKELLKRFAPTTMINTIGFWPQISDREMLREIARQSGGECVIIGDGGN